MSNIMDFGTFMTNRNAYLWNVFTNELSFINEMISMCFEWIHLVWRYLNRDGMIGKSRYRYDIIRFVSPSLYRS